MHVESLTALPRPIVVSTAEDVFDGDYSPGNLSLREAVALAAENEGPDTIRFAETLLDETITIAEGQFTLEGDLQIIGPGADHLTITGHDGTRIFLVSPEANVTIAGMTLAHGKAGSGGAVFGENTELTVRDCTFEGNNVSSSGSNSDGGAIRMIGGVLNVANCLFVGNVASDDGGAICLSNQGTLAIIGSTFQDNRCSDVGGALDLRSSTLTVTDSTFEENQAGDDGGAVYAERAEMLSIVESVFLANHCEGDGGALSVDESLLNIVDSTFEANQSGVSGGAIFADASDVSVSCSTFVENHADDAGGVMYLDFDNIVEITNSTFSGNSAGGYGGVLRIALVSANNTVTAVNSTFYGNTGSPRGAIASVNPSTLLVNCIFAGNQSPASPDEADVGGTVSPDCRGNLFQSTPDVEGLDPAKNRFGVDPRLGPLADNGGPTLTHALLPGSPAIDAGVTALATNPDGTPLEYDQRGLLYPRVVGGAVDIGAVEYLFGDANGDNVVGSADLDAVRASWGEDHRPLRSRTRRSLRGRRRRFERSGPGPR